MEKIEKKKSIKDGIKNFFKEIFQYPIHLLIHPIGAWEEFKYEKKGKTWVAIFYSIMMIFAVVIQKTTSGFLTGLNVGKKFNILSTVSIIVLAIIVATIANWCITTISDGKGKIKDIFKVIGYSFFPFVWISLFATILGNFVVENEVVYVIFFNTLAIILTGYLIFFGLQGIHEYGLLKNILTLIGTIVGIIIIVFTALLFVFIIQQVWGWIVAIYQEIKVRYF